MANLGKKCGIFHVRFRFHDREYKKSLKTCDKVAAEMALHSVELTVHRLLTGLLFVPEGVDPGDFIVSGGTRLTPAAPIEKAVVPPTRQLVDEYLKSQVNLLAESYHASQALHLRHFVRHLASQADIPGDKIIHRDLDRFLQNRLALRDSNTVCKERITLIQFYKWVAAQGYISASPASSLPPIKGGKDRPPFRTIAEIKRLIERGGLSEGEILDLWECLYLSPEEIASLLATVRINAREDFTLLLHAIPAYTGMQRGEVLRLRWLDVDFTGQCLYARSRKQSRRKTETVRRIDMHPELKMLLEDWRRQRPKGQFVLCDSISLEPIEIHRANRCFRQPLRGTAWSLDDRKGWFKVGFHSYRHSFASNLAARAVDQRIIDEFLGHTTDAMRRRYRHLFLKDRRAAIECFSLVATWA